MMQRNLVTSVLLNESIRTTKKRAEVIQPLVEKMITIAKKKEPYLAIRAINAMVTNKNACRKTMEVLKPRFSDRQSGFTRIVPLGMRAGDGAKVVVLSLVEGKDVPAKAEAAPKEKKPKTPAKK
jgi:large subunit ribosomal protein L17